jgi:hypothetical protein
MSAKLVKRYSFLPETGLNRASVRAHRGFTLQKYLAQLLHALGVWCPCHGYMGVLLSDPDGAIY